MSLTVDLFAGAYFYLSFLEFFLAPQSEGMGFVNINSSLR